MSKQRKFKPGDHVKFFSRTTGKIEYRIIKEYIGNMVWFTTDTWVDEERLSLANSKLMRRVGSL